MNKLQKLIEQLKDEKSKAMRLRADYQKKAEIENERAMAFDDAIMKAELLLSEVATEGGDKDAK
jgi:hypothetical protein